MDLPTLEEAFLGKRGRGKHLRFIKKTLAESTDKCVLWPFYVMKEGYGQAATYRGVCLAHRLMCMFAHGHPPDSTSQAVHRCGVKACVNPRHLRWGTQKDNEDDKHGHGTWFTRISNGKLTEEQVRDIRHRYAAGEKPVHIASATGVPRSTVAKVARRHTWKHIT